MQLACLILSLQWRKPVTVLGLTAGLAGHCQSGKIQISKEVEGWERQPGRQFDWFVAGHCLLKLQVMG